MAQRRSNIAVNIDSCKAMWKGLLDACQGFNCYLELADAHCMASFPGCEEGDKQGDARQQQISQRIPTLGNLHIIEISLVPQILNRTTRGKLIRRGIVDDVVGDQVPVLNGLPFKRPSAIPWVVSSVYRAGVAGINVSKDGAYKRDRDIGKLMRAAVEIERA